jgi:hypothetical protein
MDPNAVGLLHVWPSFRRIAGARLQLAVTCGASRAELVILGKIFLNPFVCGQEDSINLAGFMQRLRLCFVGHYALDYARYFAKYFPAKYELEFASPFPGIFAHDFTTTSLFSNARRFAGNLSRYFACASANHFAIFIAEYFKGETAKSWLAEFSRIDLSSFGRAGARAQLARMRPAVVRDMAASPQIAVLTAACKLSFRPTSDSETLDEVLRSASLDRLWAALAGHLSRRLTPEDRAFLVELAQHPEHRDPPLSWGLQYIVRGDVMLEDGSVVTLDELADEAGLPHLPFLDEMPDELEIDWDAEKKNA